MKDVSSPKIPVAHLLSLKTTTTKVYSLPLSL